MKFFKQEDKQKHMIVSFMLTVCFSLFLPIVYAVLISFLIGVSKEIYDKVSGKGKPEVKDIYANCIGIFIASIFVWSIT